MRNTLVNTILDEARKNNNLYVVAADISPSGNMQEFIKEFPNNFINVGVAEQAMIGVAAGLSAMKSKVIVYTIAPFSFYRPFEFIRNDIVLQKLPVIIVGMGAGLIYSNLGLTHQSIEDVSIASSIPGLQVIAPCDPEELDVLLRYLINDSINPAYVRIGKSGEKVLGNSNSEKIVFGKIRELHKGESIAVLTYGVITSLVSDVINEIQLELNKNVSLYSVHTIKPLDLAGIKEVLNDFDKVVVIEECVNNGSLGQNIVQFTRENNLKTKVTLMNLGDLYIEKYGTYEELLSEYGLTKARIKEEILG